MTLLIASTRVTVLRAQDASEVDAEFRTEDGSEAVEQPGTVRAHISSPTGSRNFSPGGSDSTSQFKLLCDPCDLQAGDFVRDVSTGQVYAVDWAVSRSGLLPHHVAGVTITDRVS